MSIASFAVSRPVAVTMRIVALVLLGWVCLMRLPVDLLPNVTIPSVSVTTQWPNVAPEEIEAQITRPMERAVSSVPGMYQVTSSSVEGRSQVRIAFRWGVDIGQAAVDVLQQAERAQRSFPNDPTIQKPTIMKMDPTQMPIVTYAVSGINDPVKLRSLLDNQITPMLDSVDGVASATVSGGQERNVIIDVDPYKLRAHHLSLSDISRRIQQENINVPAGIAKQGNTEYTIRSTGWFKSIDEITKIPLGAFDGQLVSLGDVATVRDFHSETRNYARFNGKPSASITITKQSGANTVSTAQGVFDRIEKIKKLYPKLTFGLAYDQSAFIRDSVNNVRNSAVIGGILAVLLLLFFLRNVRSTLVVALSIPTSIISTFALLYMCGFTINTMSLGGLALATGLIVDDAVVVLENIFRHIERDKKSAREAAVSGTSEILSAVVASTWTVMVVFLPLLLIKGQAGQMYTQFALVVIFSLAVSLLDATTVVPMLAARFISGDAHAENLRAAASHPSLLMRMFHRCGEWLSALDNSYHNGLKWAIHHRIWTVCGALGFTALSLLLATQIGTELMPQTDSGDFSINVKLPIGTALAQTNKTMRQIEGIVQSNPNVRTAFSNIGGGSRGGSSRPNQGSVTIKLKDNRKQSTQDVMKDMRKSLGRLPGVNARSSQNDIVTQMMTGGNQNVEVDIFGEDLSTLTRLSKEVMRQLRGVQGLENVDVNWQEAMPEIQWRIDREKAQSLGVSFSDIANTINTATNGNIASYYQEKGFQYPILVQLPEANRKTIAEMKTIVIRTGQAGSATAPEVVLSQVANAEYGLGPSEITRLDRQRYVAIYGAPTGRSQSEIQADVQKVMAGIQMPEGYYWDWGVHQKRSAEEFGGMGIAVFLAIALIYMLLASQFESFVHPLTILLSVPLAGSGVVLGLFLTGRSFGLTAFIGVLMLVGIVVKNGILLVDYTNTLRRRGIMRDEALLTAGRTRLRPILMTASAAMLGMLPLALAFGKGSEVQAPMATTVIGGLLTSTALTLFVVPVVYSLLDDALGKRRAKEPTNE
ncbi:MAG: efflux RND transporter permease subunit [Armatimonadetes bacterium]|nr:efflux RND transporter permease subunit [Armatimonadota bacterium]